jgi:hypothetical protein
MVEVGTWSLITKVTPKKNRNQKNSSDTVKFFDLRIFSLCDFLWVIYSSEFVKATVNTAKYARNTLLALILMSTFDSGNQRYSLGIGIPCVNIYSTRISSLIHCHALRFQDSKISFPVVKQYHVYVLEYCAFA